MNIFYEHFMVSGVETWLWLPPLTGFILSFFCSMAGISGAFLLMPFQISVLNYTGPSATATNFVFNLFATPGGVWRYWREGRMFWSLAALIIVGTLPGIVLGFYLRLLYLAQAGRFKIFVGVVMLYLSWRLLSGLIPSAAQGNPPTRPVLALSDCSLSVLHVDYRRVTFSFQGQEHGFSPLAMLMLAFVVGIIGGTYGIGGGAIMVPFCIAVFRLPVHVLAGAALLGTFATSVFGVLVYSVMPVPGGGYASPDWWLGSLFGLGGVVGMYLGAMCQKHVSQLALKGGLGIVLAGLGGVYLFG
ncbi:MAG: sulfite exporter TauE/SafE family protein [Magnetococcus sp. YQC-5]